MVKAARITEAEFTRQLLALGRLCRWHVLHIRPAMTKRGWRTPIQGDGKGFVDLVLVRERVVWAELKVPPNKPTPEQLQWMEWLRGAGQEVYLWTPDQWPQIERVLGYNRTD